MSAIANRAYIAHIKEAQWGVTPATPTLQKVNFVSDSLLYAIETTTPESIRDDRQVSDVINISAGNEGGLEFEMQALHSGPGDEWLLAALWAEQWNNTTAKLDWEGAVLAIAGPTIDFTAATGGDPGFSIGDKFVLAGATNAGNNQEYEVTDNLSAPIYSVDPAPAADETLPAAASGYQIEWIKNGLFEHSFSIERGHADVGEYFLYTGMVCNEFSLTFEAGAIVTGSYSFIGKSTAVAQVPNGGAYEDPSLFPFMSAGFNVKNVEIDGLPIAECLLQSVELNINNNVAGKMAVGAFEYCDTSEGEFEVSGAINLYFNDSTFYQKFVTSDVFALKFTLEDNEGNWYRITLPRCKLSTDVVNVEGKNTDVMDAAEYFAILDEALGCTIMIERLIVSNL